MSTEEESWKEKFQEKSEGSGRDGYRPASENNQRTEGTRSATGRTMRPRISRPAFSASADGQSRSYRPQNNNREGGYQPRPRYNNNQEGGYQQRPRYNANQEGGYQPRPRYNSNQEGGYQQRPRYNNNQEGGYQPRPRYNANQEGGYQQRPRYNNNQEGGYQPRPRYNNNQEGGYQPRQQQGGYQSRQQRPQRRQHTPGYNPNAKYSMKKQIEYKETHIDPDEPIRLNKYLANAGVCSRREADDFITAGVVSVNGEIVTELGTKVKRSDTVLFHDQLVSIEKKVYVLLNKPKDCVTTSDDPQNRKTVMDLVKGACRERIYPVGRLDRNTTGVLLLTNDGELASKLTHPQFMKKKIYHVHLDKNVTAADMRLIADGITLEDGEIHADSIEYASETDRKQVGIEIHSGRNRIVRRIFESLGYHVVKLDRVFFAGLTKKNVRRGDWRFLTEKEVNMLRMGAFE